jgi:hypothetical protein
MIIIEDQWSIEGSKNMTAIIVIAVVAVVIGIFLEHQNQSK